MQQATLVMRLPLQLAEDRLLVLEEVADEFIRELLVHRHRIPGLGAEHTRREGGGELDDVSFVSGGEVDEAGEVRGDGVEGGDVIKAELAEGRLEDFDARCGGGGVS